MLPYEMPAVPFPSGREARISLIMPIRNEERDLPATLHSLAAQTIDHARLRLYIVDGRSDDRTVAIAEEWFSDNDIAGGIVTNPGLTIPSGLNVGIRYAASDDIIVRLDGHTLYGPTYLHDLITVLEAAEPDIACVGGPQRPTSDASFEHRLVGTLYSNPMGLGGAEHRVSQTVRYVNQVYLGAWRPGVLQLLGGFDERWRANEDSELSARILRSSWRILWAPLDCTYAINRGVVKSIRQWGGYGFWRAQTLRRYPDLARPRHFIPPLAVIAAVVVLFTPLRPLLAVAVAVYIALVVAKRAPTDSLLLGLAGAVFFPLCQLAWTIGLLRGLVSTPPPFQSFIDPSTLHQSPVASSPPHQFRSSWKEE